MTTLGQISISNDNPLGHSENGFKISPMLQEFIVYTGQLDCYAKSSEIINKFFSIEVCAAQVFRVTDFYGEALGEDKTMQERTLPPVKQDERLYIGTDGCMVSTRDDGWKEVKLGRFFKSGDCIDPNGDASWIRHSQYLAHIGNCKTFTAQMDSLIESYGPLGNRLVFLSDGAAWIRNWIDDAFPDAVSILDYYHASEHLYKFVDTHFTDKEAGLQWAKEQEALLKDSGVATVIKNIASLPSHGRDKDGAQQLTDYFENNKNRMDYKYYKTIGAGIIGSGAIESAHRTVIQKRMKLSGQRWTVEGAQNMLNIRTAAMSEQWSKVIHIIKHNCTKAA